jgi:hypothetical protein
VSGARCAERASEAGARGRTNKVSGRLITAILFGSAARRCSGENRIFCYQMTVRLRLFAEVLLFEVSRRCSSATPEKLSDVRRVRNRGITEGSSAHLGALGLSAGLDIQPSISIAILIPTFLYYAGFSRAGKIILGETQLTNAVSSV